MRRRGAPGVWLLVTALCAAGCVATGTGYQQTSGSPPRQTTTGRSPVSATSGTTSGGGTTSGMTTSGTASSTGGSCPPLGITDCPSGLQEVSMSLLNACQDQPITQPTQVQAVGAPQLVANTFPDCSNFHFCVDAGTLLTMEVSDSTYVPTILETLNVEQSHAYTQLPLLCSEVYDGLTEELGNGSLLVVAVFAAEGNPACCDLSGWSFTVTDMDGGAIDNQIVYLAGSMSIDPGATATLGSGIAILYGIPSTVPQVILTGTSSTSNCLASNFEEQWTNTVYLQSGVASIAPFLIDTDGGIPPGSLCDAG
jgi:hypothetical protein